MTRLTVLFVTSALLAGCGSTLDSLDSLNPFSGPPKPRMPLLDPLEASLPVAELWRYEIGQSGNSVFEPAVIGNSTFVAARDGTIARLDDGKQVWKINAGKPLSGGIGANGHQFAVGTEKGNVLVFDLDGKPLWEGLVSSEVLSAPLVTDDMVFVRSADSRIQAFAALDGARKWNYQRPNPSLTLRTHAGVVSTPSLLIAGFPGGKLVAINRSNGVAVWESNVALSRGATELERIADVSSPPVVVGRDVCASAFQGRVACFELSTGKTIWTRDISSAAGIDIDAHNLYVSDDNGAIHALDRATGASVWKQDKLKRRYPGRPMALEGVVAVADGEGLLHVLSTENGAFVARVKGDGSTINASLRPHGTAFVAQSRAGIVRALSAR